MEEVQLMSNAIINDKEGDSNSFKVSEINNITESELKFCVIKILESNPNAIFVKIEYSKENQKISFYTDKVISTEAWETVINENKIVDLTVNILYDIQSILKSKNEDLDCISLYDVSNLIKKKNYQYMTIKEAYEKFFNYVVSGKYSDTKVKVLDFDYEKSELKILLIDSNNYYKICLKKDASGVIVAKPVTSKYLVIFNMISDDILKLYAKLDRFDDFYNQYSYGFKASNTNLLVNISRYGTSIFDREKDKTFIKNFEIHSYGTLNEYNIDCKSNIIEDELKGHEDEIFKKIYVKIENCPKWSRDELYQIRYMQLDEEKELKKKKQKKLKRKKHIL